MRFAIDEFRTKIEDNIAVQQMLHFYEYASLNSNLVYLAKKKKWKLCKLCKITWLGADFFSASAQGSTSVCSGIFTEEKIHHVFN